MMILNEIIKKFKNRINKEQEPIKFNIPNATFLEYKSFKIKDPISSKSSTFHVLLDIKIEDPERIYIFDLVKIVFEYYRNLELLEENLYLLYGVKTRIIEKNIYVGYFE